MQYDGHCDYLWFGDLTRCKTCSIGYYITYDGRCEKVPETTDDNITVSSHGLTKYITIAGLLATGTVFHLLVSSCKNTREGAKKNNQTRALIY